MSQLKKYLRVPEEQISLEELTVKGDFTYEEYPVKILEIAERVTGSRVVKMCKVQWNRYYRRRGFLGKRRECKKNIPAVV